MDPRGHRHHRRLAASRPRRGARVESGRIRPGAGLVTLLTAAIQGSSLGWKPGLAIAAYAAFMTLVCMLACVVPARRALRVQPTDALRSEG